MQGSVDALDALRSVRLPPVPASDLLGLVLLAVAAGVLAALLPPLFRAAAAAWRGRRRTPRRQLALALAAAAALPPEERLAAQAAALRAHVAAVAGAEASLATGEAWLERLDALFATDFFRQGPGRVFGEALYAAEAAAPVPEAALIELTRRRAA